MIFVYLVLLYLAFGLIVSSLLFHFDETARTGSYVKGYIFSVAFWPLILLILLADVLGFLGE